MKFIIFGLFFAVVVYSTPMTGLVGPDYWNSDNSDQMMSDTDSPMVGNDGQMTIMPYYPYWRHWRHGMTYNQNYQMTNDNQDYGMPDNMNQQQ